MVGYKQTLCALLLTILLPGVAIAQNNTNSPYTRYGYGQLADQSFANSKAMGGIAYGLRDGSHINPLNPASYTAIDSLTFLFDGGFSMQNTNFSSDTGISHFRQVLQKSNISSVTFAVLIVYLIQYIPDRIELNRYFFFSFRFCFRLCHGRKRNH